MAPVSRRSFLAGLIAAPVIGAAITLKYRPYRVGDHTIAVDDARWDSESGPRVTLWDGDCLIKVVHPVAFGRELIVPVMMAGGVEESRFRYTRATMTHDGITEADAQYVSGPKWWIHG